MKLHAFILFFSVCALTTGRLPEASGQSLKATTAADDQAEQKQQRTRQLILKFFPKLDKDSIEGWVDTYSSMSDAELTQLLQQRQMLGAGGTSFSGLRLDLPQFQIESTAATQSQADGPDLNSPFVKAMEIINSNLANLRVAGHRCQTFCFTHSGNWNDAPSAFEIQTSWDLSSGQILPTGKPLDLALLGDLPIMFRLEPGCVLTRSGRFVRLSDGRLGQTIGDKSFALFPEVKLPRTGTDFQINRKGIIERVDSALKQDPFGQITAVLIKDTTRLKTNNGVYFTVDQQDHLTTFSATTNITMRTHALELSNAVSSDQQRLKETLDTMFQANDFGR